jgi:hypothetical protein
MPYRRAPPRHTGDGRYPVQPSVPPCARTAVEGSARLMVAGLQRRFGLFATSAQPEAVLKIVKLRTLSHAGERQVSASPARGIRRRSASPTDLRLVRHSNWLECWGSDAPVGSKKRV